MQTGVIRLYLIHPPPMTPSSSLTSRPVLAGPTSLPKWYPILLSFHSVLWFSSRLYSFYFLVYIERDTHSWTRFYTHVDVKPANEMKCGICLWASVILLFNIVIYSNSSVGLHLGWFCCFTIVTSSENKHGSAVSLASSPLCLDTGVVWLNHDSCIFNFLKSLYTDFHSGSTNFHSYRPCIVTPPLALHPC